MKSMPKARAAHNIATLTCDAFVRTQTALILTVPVLQWLLSFFFVVCFAKFLQPIVWRSNNVIFRIDNTLNIIDVELGDSIDIVCPQYSADTDLANIEYYAIYRVTRQEYDACHITFTNRTITRLILNCSQPLKTQMFTLSFRKYSPIPGGLEFIDGEDYYFTSTSSGTLKGINNLEGGHCREHAMKVTFKVGSKNDAITTKGRIRGSAPFLNKNAHLGPKDRAQSAGKYSKNGDSYSENYGNTRLIHEKNQEPTRPAEEPINRAYPFDPEKYFKAQGVTITTPPPSKITGSDAIGDRQQIQLAPLHIQQNYARPPPIFNFKNPVGPAPQESETGYGGHKMNEYRSALTETQTSPDGSTKSVKSDGNGLTRTLDTNKKIALPKAGGDNIYYSYYYKQQQQRRPPLSTTLLHRGNADHDHKLLAPEAAPAKHIDDVKLGVDLVSLTQQNSRTVNRARHPSSLYEQQPPHYPKVDPAAPSTINVNVDSNNIDRRDSYLSDQAFINMQQQLQNGKMQQRNINRNDNNNNYYNQQPSLSGGYNLDDLNNNAENHRMLPGNQEESRRLWQHHHQEYYQHTKNRRNYAGNSAFSVKSYKHTTLAHHIITAIISISLFALQKYYLYL